MADFGYLQHGADCGPFRTESNQELQALCIQFVAGWIREAFPNGADDLSDDDWKEYQDSEIAGLFSRDSEGNVFCYFGI